MNRNSICIRRAGALGDVLMLTPSIRQLAQQGSRGDIVVATHFPEIFQNSPWVARCIPAEAAGGGDFGTFVDLENAYELLPDQHPVDVYASKLGLRLAPEQKRLELFSSPEDAQQASVLTSPCNGARYVVMHVCGHRWPNRNFGRDFWGVVVTKLLKEWDGCVVQIGGAGDHYFESSSNRLINIVGKTTLHQCYEVIRGAACFVGVDTGTMHVAACTQTPIVGLFTCVKHDVRMPFRVSAVFRPFAAEVDCYGCQATYPVPATGYQCIKGNAPCVRSIHPVHVAEGILDILSAADVA